MVRLQRAFLRAILSVPEAMRSPLFGPPAVNDRGVSLDFDLHCLVSLERIAGPGLVAKTVEKARKGMRESVRVVEAPKRSMHAVEDLEVAGVPCRRYTPSARPVGRLVYLHGGGWTVGDLDSHDGFCRRLASDTHLEVTAVHYALAPGRPFPHGLNDAVAVFDALRETPGLLMLGGDSAGGNLTAAACLSLRRDGKPMPDLQLLIYPATDLARSLPSHELFATGFMLERASMDWYIAQYAADEKDPLASPLYADDLGALPEAIVLTAGFDPLRDEGEAYADRLEAAGVRVVRLDAADMVHGFVHMDGQLAAAERAVAELTSALGAWVSAHTAS